MQIMLKPSGIKSVQRGVAYLPGAVDDLNVTISSVIMSKAVVICSHRSGVSGVTSSDLSSLACGVRLSSSTQIKVQRTGNVGQCWVEWQVVEYE